MLMESECEVNSKGSSSGHGSTPLPSNGAAEDRTEHQDQNLNGSMENDAITALRTDFEREIMRLRKDLESATKAKEAAVMMYANSEKEVLKQRKEVQNVEKQIKVLNTENEHATTKNRMLTVERERLIGMVDDKVGEVQTAQKKLEKLMEEISSKDFKIKWTQNKLSAESEAHKETKEKLEQCMEELKALSEAQQLKPDQQDLMSSSSSDDPSFSSDLPPVTILYSPSRNESQSDLADESCHSLSLRRLEKELEHLRSKYNGVVEENNSLSMMYQALQEGCCENESKIIRLQESNADHLHQIASLQSDLAIADSLRIQVQKEQERVTALQSECDQLRQCNSDLLSDMALCKGKEAELLAYTQQVTEKNATLQTAYSTMEVKSSFLEEENARLQKRLEEAKLSARTFDLLLTTEKHNLICEKSELEETINDQIKEINLLQKNLDEASGEVAALKRKHDSTLRELTKELKIAMKYGKDGASPGDGISQSSRTSSSSSLNNIDSASQRSKSSEGKDTDYEGPVIPDKQTLIEKIVKLQGMLAKQQDKIDFLQDHAKELSEFLQKKNKIILHYAMSQDPGDLTSDTSDQNKAEVIKHGGIMASVYGSKSADNGMTLELSLEINQKLQALLEDTLLKNITLKGNLNTLGTEISKLTAASRRALIKGTSRPS